MNHHVKLIAALAVATACAPMMASADDKDAIQYRQQVMITLNEQSTALGMMMSMSVPDENLISHLDAIALAARVALKAFEPKAPGGDSKPTVWSDWAGFSKRMNEFSEKTAALAKLAREQGKDAVFANAMDALTCKSCHDVYRAETKK